jgi:hypothetical protein|tara:strand:- start:704 stop:1171 length:468 start_codon:yes stop_codon:yes gene_type:complete
MAKFIKFEIKNGATLTSGTGSRDVLLNVDDIENIADGAAAATVVITLKSGLAQYASTFADGTATSVAGRILTLSTGLNVNSDPNNTTGTGAVAITPVTVPTVAKNMPSQAINRALTANPGGVTSLAQLGLDGGGVRGTDSQMYFVQAVFSTDNTL